MADAMGFVSEDMAFYMVHEPVVTSLTGFDYLLPGFRVRPGLHKGGALEEWINLIRENVHGWAQTFALSASFASMFWFLPVWMWACFIFTAYPPPVKRFS